MGLKVISKTLNHIPIVTSGYLITHRFIIHK